MNDIEDLWAQAPFMVSVKANGDISYQSIFERDCKESGLNFNLMMDMIEENVFTDNDEEEVIDWDQVRKDYNENDPWYSGLNLILYGNFWKKHHE